MNIHLKKATIEEKQTIHNLIQPYMVELSNLPDDDPVYQDKDGIYGRMLGKKPFSITKLHFMI